MAETDRKSKFAKKIMEEYPMNTTACAACWVTENCLKMGAEPLLDIAEACPQVRVRRSVTEDAELWFVHNRAEETGVTIRGVGDYTIFTTDGGETTVKSDGQFRLTLPEMSGRMLVRQKKGVSDEVQ